MFALDISEHHIRILELIKKKGSFFLYGMAEGNFGELDEIPSLLKELVAKAKPNPIQTREVALVIPEEETFTHVATITKDEAQTSQAKLLEKISGVLPYAPEEIYWDWRIIEENKKADDHVDAVFVAATKKIVDTYIDLVVKAGFQPLVIETEPNALVWGALNPLYAPAVDEPIILASFNPPKATLIIFANGAIRFTTSVKIIAEEGEKKDAQSKKISSPKKY